MIKNFWDGISVYCLNHDKPVRMVVMEGDSPFYACPQYMTKDGKHPDGHEPGEKMCCNRISFSAFTKVVEKYMSIVESFERQNCVGDFTGLTFEAGGIQAKILHYSMDDVRIGILNPKAIHA